MYFTNILVSQELPCGEKYGSKIIRQVYEQKEVSWNIQS